MRELSILDSEEIAGELWKKRIVEHTTMIKDMD